MSYAVMPLADYDAVCDKVREKVEIDNINTFEPTDFFYMRSAPYMFEEGKTYTINISVADNSLNDGFVVGSPEWINATPPWIYEFEEDSFTAPHNYEACVYLSTRNGLTVDDIISENIECDGEIVAVLANNATIKSGEMADRVDEVYKSGQMSVLNSAEAFKGSAVGNVVSINDLSPIEHNLKVKLSSDRLTDFSGVKVTVSGKNLFDYETILQKYADGNYEMQGVYSVASIPLKPNTQYTVKINGERIPNENVFIASIKAVNSSTSTGISVGQNQWWTALEKVLTTDESGNLYTGFYPLNLESRLEQLHEAKVQIEEGSVATEYEPYVKYGEYSANSDGEVEGIKNTYPTMTFSADSEGVNINVNYYRDVDKVLNNLTTSIALSGGN